MEIKIAQFKWYEADPCNTCDVCGEAAYLNAMQLMMIVANREPEQLVYACASCYAAIPFDPPDQ